MLRLTAAVIAACVLVAGGVAVAEEPDAGGHQKSWTDRLDFSGLFFLN